MTDTAGADFTCPACGGPLRERDEDGAPAFACRVGHLFAADELLVEHGRAHRQALRAAARLAEEHAALERRLEVWARECGRARAADHLAAEAAALEGRAARLGGEVRSTRRT